MSASELPPVTRCECSQWYYVAGGRAHGTGCGQDPIGAKSVFAQGHDTKLAGLRIRARKANAEVLPR